MINRNMEADILTNTTIATTRITANATTNISSSGGNSSFISEFPDYWYDLWELDKPLNLTAFFKSDLLAHQARYERTYGIIYRVTGSISFLLSSAIVYHILWSHKCLSITYHRLVFALCITDMLSSFATSLSATMVPEEMDYMIPGAKGNVISCSLQGFIMTSGYVCGALYNCSICFYYLSIITYNKIDSVIERKIEPWLHGVPIVFSLTVGFLLLFLKAFNNQNGAACFVEPNLPPHCIGYEYGAVPEGFGYYDFKIPCGRGGLGKNSMSSVVKNVGFGLIFAGTPLVIMVSISIMYRTMVQIEKKMQHERGMRRRTSSSGNNAAAPAAAAAAAAVRDNSTQVENFNDDGIDGNDDDDDAAASGKHRQSEEKSVKFSGAKSKRIRKKNIICKLFNSFCLFTRSATISSQKRAVLYMAAGYALAWTFTWIPFIVTTLVYGDSTNTFIAASFSLQGFYNFFVYMAPKVRRARKSKTPELSWCQAAHVAWTSKGAKRDTSTINSGADEENNNTRARLFLEILRDE